MKEMHMTGLSHTRIYRIWIGMRARCYNENTVPYKYYGAKGIKVCEEWRETGSGFLNFYSWSILNGYRDDLTIDRIDSTKDYSPDNCKWATYREQNVHLNKKPGKSGFYGVNKHTNCDTWYGRVKINNRYFYTGSAKSPLEAAILRDEYILKNNLCNRLNGVI